MRDEPQLTRGEWLSPGAGYHSYPRRRPRFPGPRRVCAHCGLASETTSRDCPVCAARLPGTSMLARFRSYWRGGY